MKSLALLTVLALTLILMSFKKSTATFDGGIDNKTPRTNVPAEMQGQWLKGSFSMSQWWSYNGTKYEGPAYSSSVAFDLTANGDAQFYLIIKTLNGYCSTEAFTYQKGTVAFNEAAHSFTFYPQQGNYRGFYSCAKNSNFDRAALNNELKPVTYYYSFETDEYGKKHMLIRFSANETEYPSYFQQTNW